MRKLVILMLVVGMASVANADLRISVQGDRDPVDSQYYLDGSQTLKLDIWTTTAYGMMTGDYWALVTGPKAKITGGDVMIDPGDAVLYEDPSAKDGVVGLPNGEDGVWGGIAIMNAPVDADTVIYDGIILHCSGGAGEQRILLYLTDLMGTNMVVDEVIIHQVPEPMTVALLGLGGLFLLRRRK